MPLYEYQCETCSEVTEVVRKFSDPPLTVCGSCGGELRKLISSPAIQFKGSGFYITDYARSGSNGNGSPTKSEPAATPTESTASSATSATSATSNTSSEK